MKELLLIKDSLTNRISYYHLLLLMASLPFNRFYSHLILISFTLHTLISLRNPDIKTVFNFRVLVLQSVFFLTLFTTVFTINLPEAFNEWARQIPILLIPILFCLTGLDIGKYRAHLLMAFSLVCTATIVYLYLDAFVTIRHYQLPWRAITTPAFTNHNFAEPIDIHATFFSLQIAMALVYILSLLLKEGNNYYRLFYFICVMILSAGIIQLCSKVVFAALFFVINAAVPWLLLNKSNRTKFIIAAATVSVLAIGCIFALGTLKLRYITDLKADLSPTQSNATVDSRLDRWDAAARLIVQSPIAGHGAGSEIGLLREVFFTKKYYNSYLNGLNAHNQYLSFLIKSGVIGLLVYLATLVFGFKAALKKRDLLFFAFMTLVTLVSLSENLLDVDKGVMFYAFFFSFFMLPAVGENDEKRAV